MRFALAHLLALTAAACGPAPSAPVPASAPVTEIVPASVAPVIGPALPEQPAAEASDSDGPEAWLQKWAGNTCTSFDYHPHGGLQNVWCHRPVALAFATLATTAKVPVFASGPHGQELQLTSKSEFGHYNPAFVQYLIEHGVHERGSVVQRATQASYDRHLRPLAAIFWKTRAKLKAEPACLEREKAAYAAAIKRKLPGYYERWYYFMNPAYCANPRHKDDWFMDHDADGGVDGNVTKTVVGFWLRRSMDGTFDAFGQGLEKLLTAYDPDAMTR